VRAILPTQLHMLFFKREPHISSARNPTLRRRDGSCLVDMKQRNCCEGCNSISVSVLSTRKSQDFFLAEEFAIRL